ncbi:MAG: galactokinase family protein [Gammaproteobacteria bacterium]|nr:galactokinase family protein [Gammaproteobacteria bacterium]
MTAPDAAAAAERFRSTFDRQHSLQLFVPGRINLIGEHIDYCGGLVMPMAIDAGNALYVRTQRDINGANSIWQRPRERLVSTRRVAAISARSLDRLCHRNCRAAVRYPRGRHPCHRQHRQRWPVEFSIIHGGNRRGARSCWWQAPRFGCGTR